MNALGVAVSILSFLSGFVAFYQAASPTTQWLKETVPGGLLAVIALPVLPLQGHFAAVVAFTAYYRFKHPLFRLIKGAEVVEAGTAMLCQGDYVVSAIAGVR